MTQESILSLGGFRYLKWSLLLAVGSIVAYVLDEPRTVPNGGTVLGYTLGIIGALLIAWLILFGMRKRAYRSNLGTVRGWLSAHIWLGLSLLVVATLHTGFQFGINVHTLAYTLMVLVILSGIWGVSVYMRNPSLMSGLVAGKSLQQHGEVLKELDAESRNLAKDLGADIQKLVEASAGGRVVNGLFGRFGGPGRCPTDIAVAALHQLGLRGDKAIRDLYAVQVKRQSQLQRMRGFLRLKAWTDIWLLFHVPISLGLLAVLAAHIVSVLFYYNGNVLYDGHGLIYQRG
ncbi:MAG: hypothetical protein FGM40_09700 [Rhodocyclaceae bacterium]|nr:hypothetical protein [Rhodocyclaceae bacterium]